MPFLLIVLIPRAETLIRIQRYSLVRENLFLCRFGRNRRFVLLFACDTLLPLSGFWPGS
jgi:hypothetical protein